MDDDVGPVFDLSTPALRESYAQFIRLVIEERDRRRALEWGSKFEAMGAINKARGVNPFDGDSNGDKK